MRASNLAARRGAKANRRKAIVAQKRKTEALEATPAAQVARGATLPIRNCVVSEELFEIGFGTLVLARASSVGPAIVVAFLLDTYCRGVKDVIVRTMEPHELDMYLDMLAATTPLVEVEPSYGRKLLLDLAQWANAIGFSPPRGFAAAEALFGSVDPLACTEMFEFGRDGKPLYVSGPNESPAAASRQIDRMRGELGSGGFHYIIGVPSPEFPLID